MTFQQTWHHMPPSGPTPAQLRPAGRTGRAAWVCLGLLAAVGVVTVVVLVINAV